MEHQHERNVCDANMPFVSSASEKSKKDIKPKKRPADEDNFSSFSKLKMEGISFKEAKEIMKKTPNSGLKIVNERRHVSLPYHLMSGKIREALEHICRLQLNKYRSTVGGAVISVNFDGIKLVSKPRIIDDQPCFHCIAITPLVVFSPLPLEKYEGIVTSVSEGFITVLLYNVITVNMDRNSDTERALKGIPLDVGDVISVICECLQIKRGMCQMRGTFRKLIKKGNREETDTFFSSCPHDVSCSDEYYTEKKFKQQSIDFYEK